jgi:methionyl-tRNA synthetase
VPYFLSKYDPDALRFYLTATASETRDTKACPEGLEGFSWEDFVERNNPVLSAGEGNELVATARLSSRRSLGQPSNASPQGGGQSYAVFRLQTLRWQGAGAGHPR